MGGRTWQREPVVGDVIDVEPVEVSGSNAVLGRNPTGWGDPLVRVENRNLDLVLPEETLWYVREERGPFRLHEVSETHPAKVVEKTGGRLTVRFVERTATEPESPAYEFESPGRQSSSAWDGTPQRLPSGSAKARRASLDSGNRRGSKNDLLNGSL